MGLLPLPHTTTLPSLSQTKPDGMQPTWDTRMTQVSSHAPWQLCHGWWQNSHHKNLDDLVKAGDNTVTTRTRTHARVTKPSRLGTRHARTCASSGDYRVAPAFVPAGTRPSTTFLFLVFLFFLSLNIMTFNKPSIISHVTAGFLDYLSCDRRFYYLRVWVPCLTCKLFSTRSLAEKALHARMPEQLNRVAPNTRTHECCPNWLQSRPSY